LEKHGLLDWFDHWSFSDEVGVYKPDRRIFDHALAGLGGIDPAEAAHIGDLRRTDIAGAKALGITAVRYTGVYDDPHVDGLPEADLVVADHAELPAALLSARSG
jgi:putative hydrolase of the HAD superfamily